MNYRYLLQLTAVLYLSIALSGCTNSVISNYWPQPVQSESQRTIKDRLLVIQVRSIQDQILLIENSKSKDKPLIAQKIALNSELKKKEKNLLECSLYHLSKRLTLALNCATLAHSISQSDESSQALQAIRQSLAKRAKQRQVTQDANTKRKRDSLMALAKKQILQTNHSATIKTLNQLLAISPNDTEAKQLLGDLKSIQEKHVAELIAMGDQLYRDERIEQALAVWKAAQNLALDNREVLIRIERAEKVLGSVNKIKALPENKPQS